jgi:hypothetical protein
MVGGGYGREQETNGDLFLHLKASKHLGRCQIGQFARRPSGTKTRGPTPQRMRSIADRTRIVLYWC